MYFVFDFFFFLLLYLLIISIVSCWEEEPPPKATRKRKAKTTSETIVKNTISTEDKNSPDGSSATQTTLIKSYAPVCHVLNENNEEIPPVKNKKKSKNKYVWFFS